MFAVRSGLCSSWSVCTQWKPLCTTSLRLLGSADLAWLSTMIEQAASSAHVRHQKVKGQLSAPCSPVPQWPPARPNTTSTPTGCSGFLGSQTTWAKIHSVPKVAPRNTRAGQQAAGYVCRGTRSTCPKRCTAPFKVCAPDPSWKNKRLFIQSVTMDQEKWVKTW